MAGHPAGTGRWQLQPGGQSPQRKWQRGPEFSRRGHSDRHRRAGQPRHQRLRQRNGGAQWHGPGRLERENLSRWHAGANRDGPCLDRCLEQHGTGSAQWLERVASHRHRQCGRERLFRHLAATGRYFGPPGRQRPERRQPQWQRCDQPAGRICRRAALGHRSDRRQCRHQT